jgi:1-deoxy-D-xylulose-5-phosphate reductoisomerase
LLLTASGGPFRTLTAADIEHVTPQQACQHPNWVMGPKISVDSATMMNKGLEIIEACWLFNVDPSLIEVVVHPESVIHSMVEYADGSVIAQLGNPDMRTPIAYALAWPQRIESGVEQLNLFAIKRLNFEPPDEKRFPCLRLAREAMQTAGTATAILNAANEVAVAGFLNGELPFTAIPDLIAATLDAVAAGPMNSIDDVLAADGTSRAQAHQIMRARHGRR